MSIGTDKIAMSAVALGTSLPELMVSLAASRKGNSEIVVGNVLGSNIFNTFLVMGIPSLLGTLTIPEDSFQLSIPVMAIATVLFVVFAYTRRLHVWQGMVVVSWLFGFYDVFDLKYGKLTHQCKRVFHIFFLGLLFYCFKYCPSHCFICYRMCWHGY